MGEESTGIPLDIAGTRLSVLGKRGGPGIMAKVMIMTGFSGIMFAYMNEMHHHMPDLCPIFLGVGENWFL